MEYVRTDVEVAIFKVDNVAPVLFFFWGIGMNFNSDIAKMRAGRRMWEKLMKERYQARIQKSLLLRANCQTSGYYLV